MKIRGGCLQDKNYGGLAQQGSKWKKKEKEAGRGPFKKSGSSNHFRIWDRNGKKSKGTTTRKPLQMDSREGTGHKNAKLLTNISVDTNVTGGT